MGRPIHDMPSLRDDLDLMSMPFFSPMHRPDHEPHEFERVVKGVRTYLRISPGEFGRAKVWDRDILIYIRSLIVDALNRGQPISKRVVFHVHDFLRATERNVSGRDYDGFKEALQRLKTTTVITNVTASEDIEDAADGFINNYKIKRRMTSKGDEIMASCEITLSDWMYGLMEKQGRSLTLDRAYFQLQGGIERQLYGIIRKHLGEQAVWHVSVENARLLCGSRRDLRKFRHDLMKLVEQGLPGFELELTKDHRPPGIAMTDPSARKTGREYLVARRKRSVR